MVTGGTTDRRSGKGKIIPLEARYLYLKAVETARQGNHETALNYLRTAVMVAPGFPEAFNEMGNCLSALGQYREAIARYEKALQIDPDYKEAYRNKSNVLEQLGRSGNGNGN